MGKRIVIVYPAFGDRNAESGFNTDKPEDIVRYIFAGQIEEDLTLTGIGYDWGGNGSGVVDSYFVGDEHDYSREDEDEFQEVLDKYVTFGTDESGDGLFLLATKELKDAFKGKDNDSVLVFTDSSIDLDDINVPEFGLSIVRISNDSKLTLL